MVPVLGAEEKNTQNNAADDYSNCLPVKKYNASANYSNGLTATQKNSANNNCIASVPSIIIETKVHNKFCHINRLLSESYYET